MFKWKCKKAKWNCMNCCYGVKDNMSKQEEPETVSPAFNPPGIAVASKFSDVSLSQLTFNFSLANFEFS